MIKRLLKPLPFVLLLAAIWRTNVQSQERISVLGEPDDSILRHLPSWDYTTEAYEREALRLLIEEANHIAKSLNLPEHLPITESNLLDASISPPGLGMLGTISTSNYVYYANILKRFSYLDQRNQVETFYVAKANYLWPISRMNTNAAFQTATQIMAKAGMDVAALNRDCEVRTGAPIFGGQKFVPIYRTSWFKEGECVATVEFLEPTKTIRSLRVEWPEYNLREPIRVPNLEKLLGINVAYRREALRLMIAEANQAALDLNLQEPLPITESKLVSARVFLPEAFINRSQLGVVATTNYTYTFTAGKTVSGIEQKNVVEITHQAYDKYTWPISRYDTNSAFQVATQIMAAARMDVAALNQNCAVNITASMPMLQSKAGKSFVPIYLVEWVHKGKPVASVEFLKPTKSLRHLHVYDSKYILRKPVEIPNLDLLLSQTNAPAHTNTPAEQ